MEISLKNLYVDTGAYRVNPLTLDPLSNKGKGEFIWKLVYQEGHPT